MQPAVLLALGASLLSGVVAHPHHQDLSYAELTRRSDLSKRCEGAAAAMNRKRWAKRNAKRDLATRSANTTYTITAEAPYYDVLQNNTCILTEEVTTGPYIWPRSQTLRQDMTEGQEGVPLYLDIGVMDVNSCEPLPNVLVDVWHCNATGSYSSFTGLSPDTPFETLLEQLNATIGDDLHTDDTTFLRAMVSLLPLSQPPTRLEADRLFLPKKNSGPPTTTASPSSAPSSRATTSSARCTSTCRCTTTGACGPTAPWLRPTPSRRARSSRPRT